MGTSVRVLLAPFRLLSCTARLWALFRVLLAPEFLFGMALSVPLRNETPFVLFSDGDADEHNRTWSCTRGSSLVRSPNGSLLAFFSGLDGCADGARRSALRVRVRVS